MGGGILLTTVNQNMVVETTRRAIQRVREFDGKNIPNAPTWLRTKDKVAENTASIFPEDAVARLASLLHFPLIPALINPFMALFRRNRRHIYDLLAYTVVMRPAYDDQQTGEPDT